jgi:excisionase family DNA binding protein
MSAEDVAQRLGVSLRTVYALARSGRLPRYKVGRYDRYDRGAIEQWIANGGSGGAA